MRVLVFLLLAAGASAQTFERFGVREGLPSELINDVALAPDGTLWVGTDDGLARYDGHGFRTWRAGPGEPSALPSSRVFAVTPVAGGVWVGTARGPARLDLRTGRTTRVAGLPQSGVRDIVEDADGDLWVGYQTTGLWRYSPASGDVVRARLGPEGLAKYRRVVALARDGNDIWVEAGDGEGGVAATVCRLDRARAACTSPVLSTLDWRLLRDAGQAVLVRKDRPQGGGWVAWLNGERWVVPSSRALDFSFRSILRIAPDRAWLRGDAALTEVRADGSSIRIEADPERRGGLGGYDARALARDRQGNVWVGTESGLYFSRLPARPFQSFVHVEGDPATLGDSRVNGMAQDASGALWVTTNDGLNRIDLPTGRVDRIPAALPAHMRRGTSRGALWQVLALRDGGVLLGAKRAGVAELRDGALRPLSIAGLGSGVRGLTQDQTGRLWIGANDGLWSGASGALTQERLPDAIRPVNVVFEDPSGRLWVGSDDGLLLRTPGGAWRHVAQGRLCAPVIWSMAESVADPGALWLATVGGGLARLDTRAETVECVSVRDGMPTNSVYGVLADAQGHLWASTTSGLARVDPVTRRVVTFSSADGLAGDAFNLMAQLRLADGRLAFGGPAGLTLVDPRRIDSREPPEVVISGVERQGRLLPSIPGSGDTLRLAPGTSSFGVRFGATDFRAPRRTRYRYRLTGVDGGWRFTDGSAPRASYTGVPPGRYSFEVQAAAADTPFSTQRARLDVVVVPAVWQRTSVRALGALLLIALAGALVHRRRRRERLARALAERNAAEVRRRLADARERERVRLARDLHDGPVQTLYRVGHDLDEIQSAGGSNVSPVRARVGDVAGELRQMLTELRPTLIEHLGLGGALRVAGRRAEKRFPHLTVGVEDASRGGVTGEAALALFRIAQEAVQNAGRHAGPAHVQIRLADDGDGVALTVEDDGRGFTLPDRIDLARSEHFGLIGVQERAEAVAGTVAIDSALGRGTTLRAWVPRQGTIEP